MYKAMCLCLCRVELVLPESMLERVHHCTVKSHKQWPSSYFVPPDICVLLSLAPGNHLLILSLCIHLFEKFKIMISWLCICDWQFPTAFRVMPALQQHRPILRSTLSTLYSRIRDMACHFLVLLTLFSSFVGLEFYPCCDSAMRL
uniref:Uncharacterized protein n=1 Tax=Mus musculus TaxID=10090 RepID=Q8BU87_MOUSE|nr:unnamed protein product [Mus musculus]